MLNSLSGTWGKKEDYKHVHTFTEGLVPDTIFDRFDSKKIRDLHFIHHFDGHIHASYYDNCPCQVTRGTNFSLIGFITSYARYSSSQTSNKDRLCQLAVLDSVCGV